MSKSEDLVIVRQLYEVMGKKEYSLLNPLLTEDIRQHGLSLEQQLEATFLKKDWIHVLPLRQGKIAKFQSYLDSVILPEISNSPRNLQLRRK